MAIKSNDVVSTASAISSRRRFLAFGSAGTAAALGGALSLKAAAAPVVAGVPFENPDLVRLEQEFVVLEAAFYEAAEKKRAARALFETLAPSVPDELVVSRDERHLHIGTDEKDIENKLVWPDSSKSYPRQIARAQLLNEKAALTSPRTKIGRLIRRKLKLATAYETERAAALERSGFNAAVSERNMAAYYLEIFCVKKLLPTPAKTITGAAIKARALIVCTKMGLEDGYRAKLLLAEDLAESILVAAGHKAEAAI